MYQIIGRSENGNIGIKIEKKLTEDDYELLIPYIERLRQTTGSVSLLCDLSTCEDPGSHTLWEELVNRLHKLYEIPQVAVIIGEQELMKSRTATSNALHNTMVKYFAPAETESAWHWIEKDRHDIS